MVQLQELLRLRTTALEAAQQQVEDLSAELALKSVGMKELEQQMVEYRENARVKADILSTVEVEIVEMRAQMWQNKDHYEQMMAQVQAKASDTACDAVQSAAALRLKLEQVQADNRSAASNR